MSPTSAASPSSCPTPMPCDVVVSGHDRGAKVQILGPLIVAAVMGREEPQPIAQDAARRLQTVLDTLTTHTEEET